jgi:hypothetical protein
MNKLAVALLALTAGTSQATLIDRGGGLIYDDVLKITWLQDVNYSATQWNNNHNIGDVNGIMNWSDAKSWANNLNYFDSVRNVTWDDWRLPTTLQPDPTCSIQSPDIGMSTGFGCTGSELGHLFYFSLGGVADENIMTTHNENFDLFTNWQQHWGSGESVFYWTSTANTGPSGGAWVFTMKNGAQGVLFDGAEQHVWAVRDGDVATTSIPEPSTLALLLIASLPLIVLRMNKTFEQ